MPPDDNAFAVIDDLEDGNLEGSKAFGMSARWEFWKDETAPSPQLVRVSNECAALGQFAVHARSTSAHTGWGASGSLFFRGHPHPQPYDGRNWNALSFYIAVSPGGAVPRSVPVSISTMETAWGGRCTNCVDNFATRVDVTTRWQRFVLRFVDLRQSGWGQPQTTKKVDEIVQFHVAFDRQCDMWLDHIRFERLP